MWDDWVFSLLIFFSFFNPSIWSFVLMQKRGGEEPSAETTETADGGALWRLKGAGGLVGRQRRRTSGFLSRRGGREQVRVKENPLRSLVWLICMRKTQEATPTRTHTPTQTANKRSRLGLPTPKKEKDYAKFLGH